MTLFNVDEKQFPLTKKWMRLILCFHNRYKKPVLDLLQESYLLEWQIRDKTFQSVSHKQNYFSKSLYRQLYRVIEGWGRMDPTIDGGWHFEMRKKSHGKSIRFDLEGQEQVEYPLSKLDKILERDHYKMLERGTISFGDSNAEDVIDSIIQMRPFDEVYYDDLVAHTAMLLSEKSILASRLFLDRMKLHLRWRELKLRRYYKNVSHNKFYSAVKLIKSAVRRDLCLA